LINGGKVTPQPVNRNLLVEIYEEEKEEKKEESVFIMPTDVYAAKPVERYTVVDVLAISGDCQKIRSRCRCVVDTSMIEEVKVGDDTYRIVSEIYVVLILERP